MEWLTQNWIWIVFALGMFVLMRRGGMGCGAGGHRSHRHGHDHDEGSRSSSRADEVSPPASVIDAVSGQPVEPTRAVTCVYKDRTYYFATRENRDRFEAEPERFAAASGVENAPSAHRHHRRGC
ncbi:MAG: YHS domain-containing protein [Betaproteobacteria bacterium]|nr:MAG: YHS domain-containing protein [Betaproteobacteria bacterium]